MPMFNRSINNVGTVIAGSDGPMLFGIDLAEQLVVYKQCTVFYGMNLASPAKVMPTFFGIKLARYPGG